MKKTISLLLMSASATAGAVDTVSWLDLEAGTAEHQAEGAGGLEGDAYRLSGATLGAEGMFTRADLRRDTFDYTFLGDDITETRDLAAVSFGRVVPMGETLYLAGEIGYAWVRHRLEQAADTDDATETTPIVRLALLGKHGGFTWSAEGEYLRDAAFNDGDEDSALWWHARIGWQITQSVNIGVFHSDVEQFTSQGVSLRWSP